MKRLLIAFLLLFSSPLLSEQYSLYTSVVRDTNGEAAAAATINVYLAGTNTAATIYSDASGTVKSNPFQTNAVGSYSFFVPPGLYKITATKVGVGIFVVDQLQIGTADHADRHEIGGDDLISLSNLSGQLSGAQKVEVQSEGSIVSTYDKINFSDSGSVDFVVLDGTTKSNITASIVSDSITSLMLAADSVGSSELADSAVSNSNVDVAAAITESKLSLNFPTHASTNDPSSGQKSALVGTFGTPGSSNRYVTDQDSRMTDSRTPSTHASSHTASGTDEVSVAVSQITGEDAGTDLSSDLEEEGHASEHQDGGTDEISVAGLSGQLSDGQKHQVSVGGVAVGTPRPAINLIEGSNVSILAVDNTVDDRTDVTISSTGSGGSPIVLDLGANGSDESTALTKVRTVADDYSSVTESSADVVDIDFSKIPPYRQYDPNREPVVCASDPTNNFCENWTGNTEALSFAWANQGGAAISYPGGDIAYFVGDTTDNYRMRLLAPPSSGGVDFTLYAKFTLTSSTLAANSCGITIVHGGTIESPANHIDILFHPSGTSQFSLNTDADMNSGAGVGNGGTSNVPYTEVASHWVYLRLAYVDTTRVITGHFSYNGVVWRLIGSSTAAADPVAVGLALRREGLCHYDWWRLRTDAAQALASDD